ncbi:helix-turn-helix transcriptional regulator [Sphingobium cupriresistens]|uniref:helix-turn-helix transcriptional regulator n=1 Tax=Sphingobium cupriresistens TaxID=1132417 RepID=UPI0009E8FFDA|nr:helix-turn-helix domain-containing protein [Sphingobium cupriresistens]
MSEIFVNEREAATRLGLAPATLSRWRWAGKGPLARKFGGAVRYAVSDLNQFAENAGERS